MTRPLTRRQLLERGRARRRRSPCPGSSPPAAAATTATRRRPTARPRGPPTSPTGRSTSTSTRRRRSARRWRSSHAADRDQGQLLRGDQRQRRVLREGAGPLAQGRGIDRDIFVFTDNSRFPGLLIDEGWVQKLDKELIPNISNLIDAQASPALRPEPRVLAAVAVGDDRDRLERRTRPARWSRSSSSSRTRS